MARTLGILVAGGPGTRLAAGVPKALAVVAGETFLTRALRLLSELCDEVVVCAPMDMALPVPREWRVDDREPGAGPLAAVVCGLESRPFEVALVLGVDLPCARSAALLPLRGRLAGHAAVVPAPHGRPQPLAAWYAPAAVAPLADALRSGQRALVAPVLKLPHVLVTPDELAALEGGEEGFLNVNTPADLLLAEAVLSGARA